MNNPSEIKLNIGAGKTYIPGFINIDISGKADIQLDLGASRLPFEDNSVDLIFSYHTLEHVHDYLFALSEMYRVLKPGGVLLLGLPYATLTEYHLVNPYHHHSFNEHSFSFFDPQRLKGSAAEDNSILFAKVFHRFHYMSYFNLVPPPLRGWCRRHFFNVVRKIDFGLVAVKNAAGVPSGITPPAGRLRRQFDDCLKARIPYDDADGQKQRRSALFRLAKGARAWWRGY